MKSIIFLICLLGLIGPACLNCEAESKQNCRFIQNSKESGVLIAWVTDVRETTQFGKGIKNQKTIVEPFRPVALFNGTNLKETLGATIHKGQSFWRVLSPELKPVNLTSVGSFLDHMNDDHCVYFGSFGKSNPERWTLLSSKPLPGVFRSPNPKDFEEFYRLNTSCIHQGDYPEGQEPPCIRPKLLAITDINKNGNPEYWATEPYLWDTGLTVWENNNGSLIPLLQDVWVAAIKYRPTNVSTPNGVNTVCFLYLELTPSGYAGRSPEIR